VRQISGATEPTARRRSLEVNRPTTEAARDTDGSAPSPGIRTVAPRALKNATGVGAPMAEPAKAVPKHKETIVSDSLRKHERLTLVLYLLGAVALVAGMVLISQFLSQGKANNTVVILNAVLFGLFAVAFAVIYLVRRVSDKKAAL
jgi:small neutral amino acid transporter SnatA (MarC family)